MTNMKSTKRALISSVFALVLCFAMLLGTTYAWFTDEVTSANNIIKTGTLDVQMFYSNDGVDYLNVEDDNVPPAFSYQYWEPGYVEVKYVKIVNNGDLALQYQLNIVPDVLPVIGEYNLADVIDVYMFAADATIDRAAIAAATPVCTLSDLIETADGAASGVLLPAEGVGATNVNQDNAPRGEVVYCIVLKMQEDAGNEYQNLTVGDGFSLQLLATQYTWENDAFDHTYDQFAGFPPKADVVLTGGKLIETSTHDTIWANATFQFQPTETYEEAQKSPYRYYHADFVVSVDKDVKGNQVILPGYYKAYADFKQDERWIGISGSENDIIAAGDEIRLIQVLGEALNASGLSVNYEEICKWGNDGTGFLCGVSDQSNGALAGTTMTVELRLYETTGDPSTTSGPKNEETGEYITIGTFTYTFGAHEVYSAESLQAAIDNNVEEIVLAQDIDVENVVTLAEVSNGSVTLDLNGHNIDATLDGANGWSQIFRVSNGATFTVKGEGNVHATAYPTLAYGSVIFNNVGGELIIDGGTYTMTYGSYADGYLLPAIVDTNSNTMKATTTINGGEFYHTRNMFRNFAQPQRGANNATLIINGGTFVGEANDYATIWNQKTSASGVEGDGIVIINAGNFQYMDVCNDFATGVTIADGLNIAVQAD